METNWRNSDVNSASYLMLQDLTTVLADRETFTFVYKYGSSVDLARFELAGSNFWGMSNEEVELVGYKTDVFLRAAGTLRESSIPTLQAYFEALKGLQIPKFAAQLVTCLEDLRLETLIQEKRPGTKREFAIRNQALRRYYHTQLKTNARQGYALDELFCLIFLRLHAEGPDLDFSEANESQSKQLERIQPFLFEVFSATDTCDITRIAEEIVHRLEGNHSDMHHDYVVFPIHDLHKWTERTLFDELTRTDPLANEDAEEVKSDNNEYIDQSFSTKHRENENSDRKQNMLQFELDVGTKTDLLGGENTRETIEGDDATASMQGSSGDSEKHDYSEQETLPKKKEEREATASAAYGQENQYAVAKVKETEIPSTEDEERYRTFAEEIDPYRQKLANTIKKTLEHKRNAPDRNRLFGRLSKKLLPLVVDKQPRVFYKKSFESNEIDAVFTLLIDCSASMFNKMEETKRGIVLFHEVLQQLHIPHSIVGFWEDANTGTESYYPNYFHYAHRYEDSHYRNEGARMMQLEPEEDNRDGFSIRVMTEALVQRQEKHKCLLVFSDGEPAAMNYSQNGIVDTNVAVAEARKKGIDVIGMFLSDGEISEQEEATMKNIYGKDHLMIPDVAELPDHFTPLLKKMLLRGV